ncbi:DUF4870 domain-containing protein [Gallaecimonas mangrovi]|uniref:DUF4870 domain-containing protein n=1 Tax=Gallaecimonas mangrovi TaxID=2291597 RepID=UPI001D0236DC|nr:DUF4870 domain-containing protein [Gallaecimonas mangrovi]
MDTQTKNWAVACHAAALAGFLVPLGNILGPVVVWAINKDRAAYIDEQGREAVNFQITVTLGACVSLLLLMVVIGIPLLVLLSIFNVVMLIIGIVKTANGDAFRYPFSLRFL